MGFEGRKKPPQFIINAAMEESPDKLRYLSKKGRETAAKNKAERKRVADEQAAEQAREEQLRLKRAEIAYKNDPVIKKDAFRHAMETQPPDED